jgi:hypothetical protein
MRQVEGSRKKIARAAVAEIVGNPGFLLLCAVVGISACTVSKRHELVTSTTTPSTSSTAPAQSPLRMAITDESYNGELLVVQGKIIGEIPWTPGDVAIRLVGYRDGAVAAKTDANIASLALEGEAPRSIDAGRALPFAISLAEFELSTYQIELLWGRDAYPVLRRTQLPVLAETKLAVEPCPTEAGCESQYRVAAILRNDSPHQIDSVVLGVAYRWVRGQHGEAEPNQQATDQDDARRDGEEEIVLEQLALAPGGERRVSLVVPMVANASPGGRYEPVVRVKVGARERMAE